MRSERKQEIAKAKLKKIRQQLNAPATMNQAGGGAGPTTPARPTPSSMGPPAVTPPPANVPRKAQVGRPARVAKPKTPPQTGVAGPKKPTQLKPPVTRGQAKKQTAPKTVAVADPEEDAAAPMDAEYDTDELAELPTDSESDLVESEQGEETVPDEEK